MQTAEIQTLMKQNRERFARGEWDAVEADCKPALRYDDPDPGYLTMLGVAAAKRGQAGMCVKYLEEAYKRSLRRNQLRERLTDPLVELCDPDLARHLIKLLSERYGLRPDLLPVPAPGHAPASGLPPLSRYWPSMAEYEVRAMAAALRDLARPDRPLQVLEWGSGHSTFYFSAQLAAGGTWTALEHDREWFKVVAAEKIPPGGAQVRPHLIPPNEPIVEGRDDGDIRSFRDYVTFPLKEGKTYDLLLVDGRARADCMRQGWPAMAPDGIMALHDAWREEYLPGYPDTPWRVSLANPRSAEPSRLVFFCKSKDRYRSLAAALAACLPAFVEATLPARSLG